MMAPVSLSLGLHHPQWGGVSMFGLNRPRTPTVTTTTAGNGSYSFTGVTTGFTYRITPSANRYTFTPVFQDVLVNADVSGVNFVASH